MIPIILIDINQVMISNIMMHLKNNDIGNENLIRHVVLKSLRSYRKQFGSSYGDLVICCDSIRYWRRDVFPNYKVHRREERDKSSTDWTSLHKVFDMLKVEFREHLPYKIVDVPGAEADDVIATLAKHYHPHEPILIVSSDKDFLQLQKYPNVAQYSPIQKKFLSSPDPIAYLKEHIIRGDKGDGVPNILSDDDCIVTKRRQTPISIKSVTKWISMDHTGFCMTNETLRNYKRNEQLVDLDKIPEDLEAKIIDQHKTYTRNPRAKLIPYMMEKHLNDLLSHADEF